MSDTGLRGVLEPEKDVLCGKEDTTFTGVSFAGKVEVCPPNIGGEVPDTEAV